MNKIFNIFLLLFLSLNIVFKLYGKNQTYLNTKNIIFNEENETVELKENTKINIEGNSISLDDGVLDYKNNTFEILGEFYLSNQSIILSGDYLKGNLNLNNFNADIVSFIYEDDLKIDSENLKKNGDNFIFYNNFITSCKLDGYFNCPTWSFRIKETKYDLNEDKFEHFGSFLNIADYKVLYLPYFSHYGKKAGRKRGFLNPSSEFVIGKSGSLKFPYYIPLSNDMELTITPNFIFSKTLEFNKNFSLLSEFNKRNNKGHYSISLENIKKEEEATTYSNWKINAKQVLDSKSVIKANALLTNSKSMSRSLNEEPITFEDLKFSFERYDNLQKNDYSKFQISTVEAFDDINFDLIPRELSIYYENSLRVNKSNLTNQINLMHLSRNNSSNISPSENVVLSVDNIFSNQGLYENFINKNKVLFSNNFYNYEFTHNSSLNRNENNSFYILSSEFQFLINERNSLILKGIHNHNFIKSNNLINEESNAVTFNYLNQFNENRNYGNENNDNSSRLVYGINSDLNIINQNIELKLNQSYDFDINNYYLNTINQTDHFSDYALEMNYKFNPFNLKIDSRIDNKTFSKKEMNYQFMYNNEFSFIAEYNETNKNAFKDKSSDSKSLDIKLQNKINKNINYSLKSTIDLKNNYSPFSNKFLISFFDECSKLDLFYENSRFNDNFNTVPEEIIGLNFSFDYVSYFEIENNNNLLN